jgi:hypothetical protein
MLRLLNQANSKEIQPIRTHTIAQRLNVLVRYDAYKPYKACQFDMIRKTILKKSRIVRGDEEQSSLLHRRIPAMTAMTMIKVKWAFA